MTPPPPGVAARRAGNRPVSRFVAMFATLSLAASIAPLLTHAGGADSLIPALGRGMSFAAYCVFLLVFVFFLLPGAFRKDEGRSLAPWAPLAAFALLFAAIPGVVSAYISGVARPQALFLGGLIACACAVVMLLRAIFGRFAVLLSFILGCLLLFVLPGIAALAWSTGTTLVVPLEAASPLGWLARLAFLREPADPRGVLIAAGIAWGLVVVVAAVRSRKRVAAAAVVSLALVVPAAWPSAPPPEVVIRPVLASVVRPGARVPLAISVKAAAGGEAEVAFRSESVRVPADGAARTALVVLLAGETEAEVTLGGERVRAPIPVRFADPAKAVVGVIGTPAFRETVATVLPGADVVAIEAAADTPLVAGAYEAFDGIVITDGDWKDLRSERHLQLRDFAALGGSVVRVRNVAESSPKTVYAGNPRIVTSPWALAEMDLRRPLDPNACDPTLTSLFARPDWQALDLTTLLFFLLGYHGAFLLAFLLPLVLDSHKSSAVYLFSVGFVMVAVVLVGWWSLKQFFLRDNQVYTQALTFVSVRQHGNLDAAVRQFRCYASMSGERRDFPWDARRDLVAYRDPGVRERTLALDGAPRLAGVWLDRYQSKLLVREDFVDKGGVRLVAEDGGFRVSWLDDGGYDPLGLRLCTFTAAAVVEPDGAVRSATVDGTRITVGAQAGAGGAPAFDAFARSLVGRFRPGGPGAGKRLVILRAKGLRRLDDTTGFFHVEDLEAVVAFEI